MIEDEEDLVEFTWLLEIVIVSFIILASFASVASLSDSIGKFVLRGSEVFLLAAFTFCLVIIGFGIQARLSELMSI